ncbi:hypothetical protein [Lysobacter solisilvae (ex Woo and Kim 2020)]|uniref:HMA domain-containing protein n=1 Tax=Agrilutibacter terrestris TaxID=2865112 RepID=A0A7H0G094_9GAMM|nr:hypothetical protein [Lysobacter terrestris]QNP41710.1 hypothetical protein H8B22_05745 [Lysobacter terrestris]
MKLRLQALRDRDDMRRITHSLLQVDIGSRINFDLEAQLVRIEGRLTLGDALAAIARGGFEVASVVDAAIVDAAFRTKRSEVLAF